MHEVPTQRVVVGMSGGVDSSVAAGLLAAEGYDVVGVSLDLLSCARVQGPSCCSARDRQDARAVCRALGIRHAVRDARAAFREAVIQPFVEEYLRGRTPSPCIRCNERIKFPLLCEAADRLGAPHIATGHYARVVREGGRVRLLRALDRVKDQSYFLFSLTERELARLVLPLGERTKAVVRKEAARLGLPTHEKAESQEICFVPDGDYARFIEERAGPRLAGPGDIVDLEGSSRGRHAGIHAYTLGQRRGLGGGVCERQYVVGIDVARNRIIAGPEGALGRKEITVDGVSWIHPSLAATREATVQVRSTHAGELARLTAVGEGRLRVAFSAPVRAPAPGQAAVFYDGDEVLGGGWIE
jgi:tRNA-uridine 2-sulfurtransferase